MKYQSEIIKEIVDTRGHKKSSLHYESECIETWIEEAKGAYPKLCDYESEWLKYISILDDTGGSEDQEPPIGEFPYVVLSDVTEATIDNVVPYAYKSAILKGNTDENLQSVKMPVLITSNEDGTKTNILTVNEPIELRGIGAVKDELDLLTGELTQRVSEIVLDGSEDWKAEDHRFTLEGVGNLLGGKWNLLISDKFPSYSSLNSITQYDSYILGNGWSQSFHIRDVALFPNPKNQLNEFKEYLSQNPVTVQYQSSTESIKTVELNIQDQNGKTLSVIKPIEGKMFLSTSSDTIKPLFSGEIPVEAITQNLASFIDLD